MNQDPNNINNMPTVNPVQTNPTAVPVNPQPTPVQNTPVQPMDTVNVQQTLQSIPNVEQTNEQFVNNTQATNKKDATEKNSNSLDIIFVVIVFIIIFAAVFVLFPYLRERL